MRLIDLDYALEDMNRNADYAADYTDRWLEELPVIDSGDLVPVRHGKWIYGNDFHWYTASCSVCGYQRRTDIKATVWNQWKYCPNCGARMIGR